MDNNYVMLPAGHLRTLTLFAFVGAGAIGYFLGKRRSVELKAS